MFWPVPFLPYVDSLSLSLINTGREAMEEALRAAAEDAGGDLTIEQVTRLHNEQVRLRAGPMLLFKVTIISRCCKAR